MTNHTLTISRACEQRKKWGMPLNGAFRLEAITRLHQAIADLGEVLAEMTDAKDVSILQDQLAACHEALCDTQNEAVKRLEQVRK